MWRSPDSKRGVGRKFTPRELSALIYPLDVVLDELSQNTPPDVLSEATLHKMDEDELIFGFYELFQALLTDLPVPKGEHPGYQEAMVAELLGHAYALVELECECEASGSFDDDYDIGAARRAAWTSYLALCYHHGMNENLADVLEIDIDDPEAYLSPKITRDDWESILVTGNLFDALLWDTDWKVEVMFERSEETTREIRALMGYDLEAVQRLAPTPTPEQLDTAIRYLRGLSRMIG